MKIAIFSILMLSGASAFADTVFNVNCESGGATGHWFEMSEIGAVTAEQDYVQFVSNESSSGISYNVESWSRTPFSLRSQKISGGINENVLSFTYNAKENDDPDGVTIQSVVIVTESEKVLGVTFQGAVSSAYTYGAVQLPIVSMTTVFINGDVLSTTGGICKMSVPKTPEESEDGEI